MKLEDQGLYLSEFEKILIIGESFMASGLVPIIKVINDFSDIVRSN